MKMRVLLVDSDESVYFALRSKMGKEKYDLELVNEASDVIMKLGLGQLPVAVIFNKELLEPNCNDFLDVVRTQYPHLQIVLLLSEKDRELPLSGFENVEETVNIHELPFALKYCLRGKTNTGLYFKRPSLRILQGESGTVSVSALPAGEALPVESLIDEGSLHSWENNLIHSMTSTMRPTQEPALHLVQATGTAPNTHADGSAGLETEAETKTSSSLVHIHGRSARDEAQRHASGFTTLKRKWCDEFEKRYLTAILARNDGNVSAAARDAKIDRSNLLRLMRRHALKSQKYRKIAA